MNLLSQISFPARMSPVVSPEPSALLEILVIAILFYYLILFFKGTRGAAVLTGFLLVLVLLLVLTQVFHLSTLNWLLSRFSGALVIAFVIIFHPEIRGFLAELGKQNLFATREERGLVGEVVKAVCHLADKKIGALIAIEREIGTRPIQESGIPIDSQVSSELLTTLFFPNTPLHDGGVIIQGNRVAAAGCVFPLSQRDKLSKSLGTRHRAAIGITEETDAIVIVVSEETGAISVAFKGRLSRGLDEERLRRTLATVLIRRKPMEGQAAERPKPRNPAPERTAEPAPREEPPAGKEDDERAG